MTKLNDTEQLNTIMSLLPDRVKTVVDVGGHHGEFLSYFKEHGPTFDDYYLYEPDIDNYQVASEVVDSINHAMVNADEDGWVYMYNWGVFYGKVTSAVTGIGDGNNGGYMVADIDDVHTEIWKDRLHFYEGKYFSLMELEKAAQGENIDVLKLDCEGSEYNIFENSPSISKIPYIICEFHNHDVDYVNDFLYNCGIYETHTLEFQHRQWLLKRKDV